MQREAVYDLAVAPPHEPEGARFTAEEWRLYVRGYGMALTMALRTMDHAEARYRLYLNTRRLDTRRQRERDR